MGKYLIVVLAIVVSCGCVSLAELECTPGELLKRPDSCLCYCSEDGKTEICPPNGCPQNSSTLVPPPEKRCNSAEEICETQECLRSAATLRMNLDMTADPCEDFYQFTCGNWANNHPDAEVGIGNNWYANIEEHLTKKLRKFLEKDDSEVEGEVEPVPVKQTRSFYSTCMDTESMDDFGYDTVELLMARIEFPEIPQFFRISNSIEEEDKTTPGFLLGSIQRLFGRKLLFSSGIRGDLRNNSVSRIYIDGMNIIGTDIGVPQ